MLFQFASNVLLRMPAGNPADYPYGLQFFLNVPHFRAALFLATPVFFARLGKQNFELNRLTEKEKHTLQKYVNRYCFRPTPFSLFASVSLIGWSDTFEPKQIMPAYRWHLAADMTFINLLANNLNPDEAGTELRYQRNPSIYRVLNEYRFFRTGIDPAGKHRDYQLQSIAFSRLLKELIAYCEMGRSHREITSHIASSAECQPAEAADYLVFLIDAQLLTSCQGLQITGKDQLERLAAICINPNVRSGLNRVIMKLANLPPREDRQKVPDIVQIQGELAALLPGHVSEGGQQLNIILQRLAEAETLEDRYQQQIEDGIEALDLLSTDDHLPAMSDFLTSFRQHFEGRSIPLLLALDPEAGIGYQQPGREKNNPLLETLNIPVKSKPKTGREWSGAHTVLMEAWLRDRSETPVIQIRPDDLERLRGIKENRQIMGMSVLFRVTGEKVFIENAGGINAPALMGRFTVADEKIHAAAVEMARHLEEQNPGIIFAELLHLSDPHTDNINRRESIYHYEIPITAVSDLPVERQIQLSDLYVSVADNLVVLFSEKHQKVVVPRLTSAYNHSLNKLPLFRFLADLPYQYGRHSLGFDLRQFFPGLKFYPRVEYRKTILSLATWVISAEQLDELRSPMPGTGVAAFRLMSEEIGLSRYFTLAEGDQELVFDRDRETDILFFCNCVRLKQEAVLKEFLEQPFIRQYNAYLLPGEPLILPKLQERTTKAPKVQRKYIPGSEWLYLKIYAPKIGADRLLLRLRPLISKRYTHGKIRAWFFIRYEDHAPHIRLRLKVVPADISEILLAFKIKLEDRIQQHVIREYQVDVYSRELERYAAGGIENTERLFWASSELSLCFLAKKRKKQTVSNYVFALYTMRRIINEFIRDPARQIAFTADSFRQFIPEFTDKPFKADLDRKYRELSPTIMEAFKTNDPGMLSGSTSAAQRFLRCLRDIQEHLREEKTMDYLRSIVHMHLNRIFTDESRKQEMISYYLLHKYLLSQKARSKQEARISDRSEQDAHP